MSKANYFLLCENIIIDEDQKTTLVNIFDGIGSPVLPFSHPKFVIAFSVRLEGADLKKKELKFRIELVDPEDKIIGKAEGVGDVEVNPDVKSGNVVSSIDLSNRVNFSKTGQHTARFFFNDELLSTAFFEVIKARKEEKR
jgi:hypothetical protein